MSALDNFEGKDFDVVKKLKGNNRCKADVVVTISRGKQKQVNFGISAATLAASKMDFKQKDLSICITPIINNRTNRLYFVEDEDGYKMTRPNRDTDRVWSNSQPLYEKFVRKYGFTGVVDGKLKWDNDLQAYYVEVQ